MTPMTAVSRPRSVRPEVIVMMVYANRRQAARAVVLRLAAIIVAVSLMVVLIALASQHRFPRMPSLLPGPEVRLLGGGPR
jgi:hypothetical protein